MNERIRIAITIYAFLSLIMQMITTFNASNKEGGTKSWIFNTLLLGTGLMIFIRILM